MKFDLWNQPRRIENCNIFYFEDVDDDYVRIVYEAVTQQSADSALTLSAFVVQ